MLQRTFIFSHISIVIASIDLDLFELTKKNNETVIFKICTLVHGR